MKNKMLKIGNIYTTSNTYKYFKKAKYNHDIKKMQDKKY